MYFLIFALSIFFFTSSRAMDDQDYYDEEYLESLWNHIEREAQERQEPIANKETINEQTIEEFESHHQLKTCNDLLRLLEKNIFHNGMFLWCIAKGYRLMTVKKVGALLRKKIGEKVVSQQDFESFVEFHNRHPLNPQEVEGQTIRYVNKLFAKTYTKIQKEMAKEKPKNTRKKGVLKRIPAAKKLIESNSLEFHFVLCESSDGRSVLLPHPTVAYRKRGEPKSLEQIVCRNT